MDKIRNAWNDINKHDVEQPTDFSPESGEYKYDDGRNYIRLQQAQAEILNDTNIESFYEWLNRNDLLLEAVEVVKNLLSGEGK